jgi:threonine dehydrogenase-like Zn-dependent dehydrogenase
VAVRIKSCGICATDHKAVRGIRKNVTFPAILGHEPSGIVAEVGPGVTHFKEGDEVIVMPGGSCGFCEACRTGRTHYCEHAFTTGGDGPEDVRPGAFAEYMKTVDRSLFHKPPQLSFDGAAITEPLSGAWKGVIQYSQMEIGDDVVVIGVGSIGLLCMMVARAAGAGRLIAVDASDFALANALKLGATHVVNPAREDARKRVYEIIPGGPDLIVEAAGPIQAVQLMVDLRRRGTKWNLFGITTHEKFELDGGYTHFLEGRMDASFGCTLLSMSKAIRLMQVGLIDTGQIISHRFPLSHIHEALAVMDTPDHNKVIINP